MKNILTLLLISLVCCNNKSNIEFDKDYTKYHSEALEFIKSKDFNTDFYYLIDMSVHSGKNRFLIYDFSTKKIVDKNIVTHGSCDQFEENPKKWEKAKFSTKNESHCSMKGKYKIGNRDYSSWGINVKYWIHGLENSNNTAVKRVVVLHSWDAVKNEEIYPRYSPLSWGCPAVSNEFMKKLDEQLKSSNKPVLLWIIE
jgi:hypothetical protein